MIYGRDFLTLLDFSAEEIRYLIKLSLRFKRNEIERDKYKKLDGMTAALVFEKPSTRTRMSLEVACHQLGIKPIYVSAMTTQLARGEPIEDFARVIERYVDLIAARVYSHKTLEDMARYANVPVINALSDMYHPLQALADYMTILEKFGRLDGLIISFVGDVGNNVARSLTVVAAKLGLEMRLVGPRDYWPGREFIDKVRSIAEKTNAKIVMTEDPTEGVKGANVIYTDVWVSMGQEKEREKRIKVFRRYQVNEELVRNADKDYIFMHCLPRHRGEEVSDGVFESENSVVFDQAENRLHSAKAVIASVLLREKL